MKGNSLSARLGKAVRLRREALGIRQQDVAKKLNMHRTYYGAIERGQKNVRLDTLQRLCEVLKIEVWELMQEAEEPVPRRYSMRQNVAK